MREGSCQPHTSRYPPLLGTVRLPSICAQNVNKGGDCTFVSCEKPIMASLPLSCIEAEVTNGILEVGHTALHQLIDLGSSLTGGAKCSSNLKPNFGNSLSKSLPRYMKLFVCSMFTRGFGNKTSRFACPVVRYHKLPHFLCSHSNSRGSATPYLTPLSQTAGFRRRTTHRAQ